MRIEILQNPSQIYLIDKIENPFKGEIYTFRL